MPRDDALYWLRGNKPTEADWLHSDDRFFQSAMLEYLREHNVPRTAKGRRKLRLLACSLCRLPQVWPMINRANRRALEEIERQAETGKKPSIKLPELSNDRYTVVMANSAVHSSARANAGEALRHVMNDVDAAYVRNDDTPGACDWTKVAEMDGIQRHGFREVFGNPFRKVKVERGWLKWHDATVVKLAQAAYEQRELPAGWLDTRRLAILADALEEAGCTNEDMLSHLRSLGPHVRGCWVVDLLFEPAR